MDLLSVCRMHFPLTRGCWPFSHGTTFCSCSAAVAASTGLQLSMGWLRLARLAVKQAGGVLSPTSLHANSFISAHVTKYKLLYTTHTHKHLLSARVRERGGRGEKRGRVSNWIFNVLSTAQVTLGQWSGLVGGGGGGGGQRERETLS